MKIGDIINGQYRLMEEIGRGGGGIVYKAYHMNLEKIVVLKLIKSGYTGKDIERREVDILKNLHHNYLPQVYDFVRCDGNIFTVMEYIPGRSLESIMNSGQTIPEADLLKWLKQLSEVLVYLHGRTPALFHNDIKPANIMISPRGDAFLIDFNISLTELQNNRVLGYSKFYASPEQLKKATLAVKGQYHGFIKLDGRSDVYSLGATFRMVMGKRHYSEGLRNIIRKATQKNPEERFKNSMQMLQALQHLEQYDSLYLKYKHKAILWRGVYLCVCLIAVICMIIGGIIQNHSDYDEELKALYNAQTNSDYVHLVEDGIGMLNDFTYKSRYAKNPEDKAAILYLVGCGYVGSGDYASAIDYFEEAMGIAPDGPDYVTCVQECAVAKARNGDFDEAREMLSAVETAAAEQAVVDIIQGEIAHAEGSSGSAVNLFRNAYQEATTEEIRVDAGRRLAAVYLEKKNYSSAITALDHICASSYVTFADQMNLVVACEYQKKYDKSLDLLKDMEKIYSDDYRVYRTLARIYIEKGDRESAEAAYRKAKNLYNKAHIKDSEMDALKEAME